jgi:hypothetical protein
MSGLEPLTTERPRSPSARIVYESCRRADRFISLSALLGVMSLVLALSARQGPNPDAALEIGATIMTALWGALLLSQRARRGRLVKLWRDGELTDVIYRSAHHVNTRAYVCVVEHDGRVARVLLGDYPDAGAKLPALIDGDWIAVQDVLGGRLRVGRLKGHA